MEIQTSTFKIIKTRKGTFTSPSKKVFNLDLNVGEKFTITLQKRYNPLADLFGAFHSKKSADQVIKEYRKEFKNFPGVEFVPK